jgi:hypothetical protein
MVSGSIIALLVNGERDFEDEAWFIEINTLKELNDFIDKYGSCVIMEFWKNPSILCIEIYDTYRE